MPRYLIEQNRPRSVLPSLAPEKTMNTKTTANRLHSLIATALFGVFSSSFAALPAAADSVEPLKVTVKFGDLNISHPQGAAVLYFRIRAAAAIVCSPYEGSGHWATMQLNA